MYHCGALNNIFGVFREYLHSFCAGLTLIHQYLHLNEFVRTFTIRTMKAKSIRLFIVSSIFRKLFWINYLEDRIL